MDNITITHINPKSPQYRQVLTLREEILRKPLGRSLTKEDISLDHINTIFIAAHDDEVIACLLLHHIDNDQVQLRAMAVYNEWQGKGIGRKLVLAAEQHCLQKGYKKIILHGRKVATGFYKSLGYTITGDEFTEVGIPHYMMEKRLEK